MKAVRLIQPGQPREMQNIPLPPLGPRDVRVRIKAAGIAQDIRYSISGRGILLKLAIRGCQHLDKERMLREAGVRPYNCVIANMICDRLIEKLGYTTSYVAQLDVRETAQACALKEM